MIHLEVIGQFLELTVAALWAEHTVVVSFGKQELQNGPPALYNPIVGSNHVHAIPDRRNTTGHKPGRPIYLNDTDPASSPVG